MRIKYLCSILLLLISCGQKQESTSVKETQFKIFQANGQVVEASKLMLPEVIKVNEAQLKKVIAGKPSVVAYTSNTKQAGEPQITKLLAPNSITPGNANVPPPVTFDVIDSPFVAGVPELVVAKDMLSKDRNPANFSTYGKLHGLKHGNVRCMLQDNAGNVWFGTNGGGVSKYNGKTFSTFTESEGLSSNLINCMFQDSNQNIWLGTADKGVVRFDGKSFINYKEKNGIAGNNIQSIMQDKSGAIWFASKGGGVSKLFKNKFTNYKSIHGLANNNVNKILSDGYGNTWFATDSGISKFDGKTFFTITEKEGLPYNKVLCAYSDSKQNLWFGTDGKGAFEFNGKTFLTYTEKEGLANNVVKDIIKDSEGKLWFSTFGGGISKFDGNSFTTYNESQGLIKNIVFCSMQDNGGNLWFGIQDCGVSKFNGKTFTTFNENDGLANNVVLGITEDKNSNLWLGSNGGVSMFDGKSFATFTDKEGLPNKVVLCLLQDRLGNFWFGTNGGGVAKFDGKTFTHFTEKDGLQNNFVYSMSEDRNGNIWFGTGKGVSVYNGNNSTKGADKLFGTITNFGKKQGLSDNEIRSIIQDKQGRTWFCTLGDGIIMYDGNVFTNYNKDSGLPSNLIISALQDKNGRFWFGTLGEGVLQFDGKTFTSFTKKEGLTNNMVFDILEDSRGNIWFATRFGLSMFRANNLAALAINNIEGNVSKQNVWFKNFNYIDGFLGIGINIGKTMKEDKQGNIWIAANDRIMVYHPPKIDQAETQGPSIELHGLSLFNEKINWTSLENKQDSTITLGNGIKISNFSFAGTSKWGNIPEQLSLAYNNNYITFHFTGITMQQPQMVKYKYMLEGNDPSWSSLTYSNEAAYGNLAPGVYTFKVKAMNSEGFWDKEARYTFTIRPPWWRTWWAYASYVLLISSSAVTLVRRREQDLRTRQKELELKVDEATQEIRIKKDEVEKQNIELAIEQEKTEQLLRNILPVEIANELKEKGKSDAKLYRNVTVLFTDFAGFTQIAEKLSPTELVGEIHKHFTAFDAIIGKHGMEKIKTIGDAYLAVCGLPKEVESHAQNAVMAALDIRDYMQTNINNEFKVRIGIHSGPVVAGIVGVKKYAYDIWGDTVNTASRLESTGTVGKVNISSKTHELIKNDFACEYRGKLNAKGKGDIDMYFVERKEVQ